MKKWILMGIFLLLTAPLLPYTKEHLDEAFVYADTRVSGLLFLIKYIFLPLEERVPTTFAEMEQLPYKFWAPIQNPWQKREMRIVSSEKEAEIGDLVYTYNPNKGIKLQLLLPPGKYPDGKYLTYSISVNRIKQQLDGDPWISYYDDRGEPVYKRTYDEEVKAYWKSLTIEEKKLSAICSMISVSAQNINYLLTAKNLDEFDQQMKSFLNVPAGRRVFDTDVLKMQFDVYILDWLNPYTGKLIKEVPPSAPSAGDYSLYEQNKRAFAICWNSSLQPVIPIWQYKADKEDFQSATSLWGVNK
ncbi:MAG: hypothetical protein V2G43_06825 [bacterium JZ-2024 1]